MKTLHEVRDGVHGFILFDNIERALIDSAPFQRLRSIHQLALTYQVYPGATHRRFEHSLGVMEIASRMFDSLFRERLPDDVARRIAEEVENQKGYWRSVIRAAALLHDIGHLPFSHAAEKDLLPDGWDHERIGAQIIRNSEIADILARATPPIRAEDVVDIAWEPRKRSRIEPDSHLGPWKALLCEMITGNSFGADRIDYLLRDSWHAGVAYGRFDPDRLISGLRIVVAPDADNVAIGLDHGAIHAAEALLLARYFMYTQVYMHEVRRAYDLHLKQFLQGWLEDGKFPSDWRKLVRLTDDEILVAVREALSGDDSGLASRAARIIGRKHYRTVYSLAAPHKKKNPDFLQSVFDLVGSKFGGDMVAVDSYGPKHEATDFWVAMDSGDLQLAAAVSGVLAAVPQIETGFVFADQSIASDAQQLIKSSFASILSSPSIEDYPA